jgi:hypothetical protein
MSMIALDFRDRIKTEVFCPQQSKEPSSMPASEGTAPKPRDKEHHRIAARINRAMRRERRTQGEVWSEQLKKQLEEPAEPDAPLAD